MGSVRHPENQCGDAGFQKPRWACPAPVSGLRGKSSSAACGERKSEFGFPYEKTNK
jgi:hypothetical protein